MTCTDEHQENKATVAQDSENPVSDAGANLSYESAIKQV